MAEGSNQRRYVKLTRHNQEPTEDITPGELNQPIEVPELIIHRCCECGQPLPESYQPPSDEDWSTGICGCADDPESCTNESIVVTCTNHFEKGKEGVFENHIFSFRPLNITTVTDDKNRIYRPLHHHLFLLINSW